MQKLRTYHLLSQKPGSLPPNTLVVLLSISEQRLNNIVQSIAEAGLPKRLFKMAHYSDMVIHPPAGGWNTETDVPSSPVKSSSLIP